MVEIMIVVAIIGFLAALAAPSMLNAGKNARARCFMHDVQTAGHAFVQYFLDTGNYPADKTPSQIPDGMADYLTGFPWTEETVVGGQWDWDYQQFGTTAGVSVYMPNWDDDRMREIDAVMDDGNLSSGRFRKRTQGYIYILKE